MKRAKKNWLMLDSNRRHLEYCMSALPTELISPMLVGAPLLFNKFKYYKMNFFYIFIYFYTRIPDQNCHYPVSFFGSSYLQTTFKNSDWTFKPHKWKSPISFFQNMKKTPIMAETYWLLFDVRVSNPQFFLELITTQLRFYMVSPQLSLLIILTMQSYKFYVYLVCCKSYARSLQLELFTSIANCTGFYFYRIRDLKKISFRDLVQYISLKIRVIVICYEGVGQG